MRTLQAETIAWVLWHIARIEDLTMGILVTDGEQLFDKEWKRRLNAPITDTGNAIGQRTHENVASLSIDDRKRKVSMQGLEIIKQIGGVTNHENSMWLLEFWGKKDKGWGIYVLQRRLKGDYQDDSKRFLAGIFNCQQ